MKIGRVVGNVVSTISHPFFDGRALLLCDVLTPDGAATGAYLIAVDVVGAGVTDTVLIMDEGTSARQLFDVATGPIRAVVVGIVDQVVSSGVMLDID